MSHLLWLRAGYLKNEGQTQNAYKPGEVASDNEE